MNLNKTKGRGGGGDGDGINITIAYNLVQLTNLHKRGIKKKKIINSNNINGGTPEEKVAYLARPTTTYVAQQLVSHVSMDCNFAWRPPTWPLKAKYTGRSTAL